MKTRIFKKALITSIPLLLIACSDSNIGLVKDSILGKGSYTVGQIYDNRNICNDSSWSSIAGANGETLVTYHCNFSTPKESIDSIKTRIEKSIENYSNNNLEVLPGYVSSLQGTINKYKAELEELNKGVEYAVKTSSRVEHGRSEVRREKESLKQHIANKPDFKRENYSNSALYQRAVGLYEDKVEWIGYSIERQEADLKKDIQIAENEYHKKAKSRIPDLLAKIESKQSMLTDFQNEIPKIKQKIEAAKLSDLERLTMLINNNNEGTNSIKFQVLNNKVTRESLSLMLDGKGVGLNYQDLVALSIEEHKPNSNIFNEAWQDLLAGKIYQKMTFDSRKVTVSSPF